MFILTWFIFAGTDVAVTKYPVYICGAGHKFYKNVLSLQDENAQCLEFWKKSMLFIGTEEIFCINLCILMNFLSPDYCKRVLGDELSSVLKIWKAYNGKVRSRAPCGCE